MKRILRIIAGIAALAIGVALAFFVFKVNNWAAGGAIGAVAGMFIGAGCGLLKAPRSSVDAPAHAVDAVSDSD